MYSTCIFENSKYLKSIADDSVNLCDEIINFTDSVSTNLTNAVPTDVTSTISVNCDDKKVRYKIDCYIHTISLIINSLLLLLVVISVGCCYYYTWHWLKEEYALPY